MMGFVGQKVVHVGEVPCGSGGARSSSGHVVLLHNQPGCSYLIGVWTSCVETESS